MALRSMYFGSPDSAGTRAYSALLAMRRWHAGDARQELALTQLLSIPHRVPSDSLMCSGVSAALGFNVMPLPSQSNRQLVESSMDQLDTVLPAWAIRAGARRIVYFDPSQVNAVHRIRAQALEDISLDEAM